MGETVDINGVAFEALQYAPSKKTAEHPGAAEA
jgi:hypothetical protein